ncbi:MAG: TonB-dependent receptor [Bacteroidota bacterium]|nr:TonB-dependent receptor [Bacteroidota bacterium]
MKIYNLIFLSGFVLLFSASSLQSQERKVTIQGSVVDSASGERIPYATVMIAGTKIGAVADVNGYFILRNVSPYDVKLQVSTVGYREKTFDIGNISGTSRTLRLELAEAPKALPGVTVTGERLVGPGGNVSTKIITAGELQKNVGVFKNDVVQYVTQLPGVVTVSGITSQYFVRGGGADENLVMIDGMPVYNLSHAFGLFSFVDPLIVKVANFSTGGFGAQYGGRLSSVFDIQTIDGDNRHYKAAGTFDLLSSDVQVTGPIISGASSFVIFFRRPLYQNALNKFYSLGLPFDFYDGFAKATTDLSGTGHISAEFLTSADNIKSQDQAQPDFTWGNVSGAVSGNYLFGDQFNLQGEVAYSSYKAEQLPKASAALYHQFTQISTPSLSGSITSYFESGSEVNLGLLFSFPTYTYSFTNTYGSVISQSESQVEPNVWTTYTFKNGGDLSFEAGVRADLQRMFTKISGSGYGYFAEPRLSVSYKIDEPVSVYAAYGMYHQRLIDLNDENLVFTPFEVVAALPDDLGDEAASQYILGVSLSPDILSSIKAEAYYKDFSRLLQVNRDKVYSYEPDFFVGTGRAYGFDLSFKYDIEQWYVEGSYSFGKTSRSFDGLAFYPRYDLRHQLQATTGWQPVDNMWLRARWKFTSGLPYTPINGFFGAVQFDPFNLPGYTGQPLYSQVLFGDLNTARLPGFQSLDLSASYDVKWDWMHFALQGTVINAYNNKNVFYINNVTGSVVYQLPTIFNVSLGWSL